MIEYCDIYGSGFNDIPGDSLGVLATANDDPLHYKNTSTATYLFDVVQKNNTHVRFGLREPHAFPAPKYIGGIVSSDRSEVLWVNETAPLP